MQLLLDTHILLWAAYSPEKLPPATVEQLSDESNDLLFSAASIWEIAIKASQRRDDFGADPRVLRRELLESGYRELTITGAHAVAVAGLPPIHRDPFDRILVAQAHVEGFTLLTSDRKVAAYGSPTRLV